MQSSSIIQLSKSALKNNYDFVQNNIGNQTKVSFVVKGNAYGHGIEEIVSTAEEIGSDHFSVFSADEGLRVFNIKRPYTNVMIMGWMSEEQRAWAIENDIEFWVFDTEIMPLIIELSKKIGKPARIHLELETGMNRTGLKGRNLSKIAKIIKENREHFEIKGLCTHYAGAESIANHVRVQKQIKTYNSKYRWFCKQGIEPEIRHTACSASSMSYPKTLMDMARVGILHYGFWPSTETFIRHINKTDGHEDPLKRVISWKSQVMTVKKVKAGEFISYGTTYLATEPKKIAVVPIGYANGYSRTLSNRSRVLIHGERVAVVGVVNMNMLITDVTYLSDVKIGDEVVLIGKQGDLEITVSSFGELSNQLNYELLTRLPQNIERVVVD